MTEGYTSIDMYMKYYGRTKHGRVVEYGAQIPFNFQLMDAGKWTPVREFEKIILEFLHRMPKGDKIEANWVVRILSS